MAHNNIEIEIKVTIEKLAVLKDFLEANATFKAEKHQVDEYFSPKHEDFMSVRPVNEWLRLRMNDGKCSMDYKLWHRGEHNESEYCDEIETGVESMEQARKILTALKFRSIGKVDKVRRAWIYKDFEIAIDSVKGLNDFVEIEYIGKDGNMEFKQIVDDMIAFLKGLDCGKIAKIDTGYIMILLFPEEAKYVAL